MYDEDLDRTPPASWKRFREQIAGARAVLGRQACRCRQFKNRKTRKILSEFFAAFDRWITRMGGDTTAADFDAFIGSANCCCLFKREP
jgi:hypothetical protein